MGSVKILKASAGSGKTFRLAYEYVRAVIEEPMQYRHILAVTFTNKATEEMKRRIVSEINDLARGGRTAYLELLEKDTGLPAGKIASRAALARTRILHDYSHFAVLTIDKFFQRIIRSFVRELGVEINFNLELHTESLLSAASDAVIDEIPENRELRDWITAFVEERIEENRRWEIKSELAKLGSEIFSESYKLGANLQASREELAAIVDRVSAKAFSIVNSMKADALAALGIMAGNGLDYSDFSGGRRSFANYFNKVAAGDIAAYGASVSNALESDDKWYSKTSPRKAEIIATIPRLKPLLEKICSTYDREHRFLNSASLLRGNYRNFALLTDLAQKLERICAEGGIVPISETNDLIYKLVCGNDAPFIFEKAGNHFHRFMIDEFQDTSSMQWRNFLPLLHNSLAQSPGESVLLVGDVKQSIYRWRGGDWRILASGIEREFPDAVSSGLTTNYRSLRNIVEFNNNIIERTVSLDNTRLNAMLDEALSGCAITESAYSQLHGMLTKAYDGHNQQASRRAAEGYVNITYYDRNDDGELVPPVVRRIEELQERGYAPGDIAVLVRINRQGVDVADMLLERKRNNPGSKYSYDVVTQEALLINSSPAVGFILACMKLASSPGDPLPAAIYNRWTGEAFHRELPEKETAFFGGLRLRSPLEAFEQLVIKFRLSADRDNIAYLQAFEEQIINFSDSSVGDIPLFVKWWEENGEGRSVNMPQNSSAIRVTSIHKAKGLQYKAVIIPYCDWDLAPRAGGIIWADNDGHKDFEELGKIPVGYTEKMRDSVFADDYYRELVMSHVDNINTFYVAVTRAVEELHIMIPRTSAQKYKSGRIGALVDESVVVSGSEASVGDIHGKAVDTGGATVIEFGTPVDRRTHLLPGTGGEQIVYTQYGTYPTEGRLRLRLPSQRYTDEGLPGEALSPRDYGILMHKVFESAEKPEDIGEAIKRMAGAGEISDAEETELSGIIAKAFENPLVKSWFSGGWDTVRNENDIIVPGDTATRRPDRVMLKGRQAVVVDYKFGMNRPASHRRQMERYIELLRAMGYQKVEGYIWYISLDDIETIC